jgi:hypothetical protein
MYYISGMDFHPLELLKKISTLVFPQAASPIDVNITEQIESGILEPAVLVNMGTSPNFKTHFNSILAKQEEGRPIFVRMKGVNMPLELQESPISKGNEVLTQIKDPLYKEELLKNIETKHYTVKLRDPNKDYSELKEAEKELDELETIFEKMMEKDDLSPEEMVVWDIAQENAGSSDMVIPMKKIIIDSLKSVIEKPVISLRISEDGGIGEVASIAHSSSLTGSDLMKGVDDFCSVLGVKYMYLEDDAAIESPNGNYSLRLFRGYTGKNSWYEDAFKYTSYEKNHASNSLEQVHSTSQNRLGSAIRLIGNLTIKEMKEILNNRSIKSSALIKTLVKQGIDENKTLQSTIAEMGSKIMNEKAPLHKEMSAYLKDFLEALDSYRGNDSKLQALKKDAEAILNNRFFSKSYCS